ncbi:MAG: hypothetical protein IKK33_17805 [Lachnospiraceae bacterium]|nr:hypothetical protein [Lachnospiraceae bacterium]
MLAFLLGLLKIIGIVLLALLVGLLMLVVLVLLVPIKYHAVGVLADDEKRANADITWLCKFIKLKIDYLFPEKPVISLKIMGFELFKDNDKTKKNVKVPKELKKIKKKNISSSKKIKKKKKEKYHPTINSDLLELSKAEKMNNEAVDRDDIIQEPDNNRLNDDVLETANNSFSENKIEKIMFKIQELYDKIIIVIDNINYYLDIWEQEDTQSLLKEAWGALKKIVISIKPKAYKLDCLFGFETPDTTGRVYGYYCMLLPWLGDNVNVEPDFEQKRINADGYVKGKILVLTVLINALHILFDKRLMPLINKLKNGGK